ncbi:hypothetical protein OMW55_10025 [Sphingomonas sp. BN140010]|uniref:Uncharacterized protein n=1 Tax=Sphingomonas arvum TaxID=2992113 RepID=A0ABT3JGE6_9SPHN|nr:hypothetical protein [Sphingomonas sp. BN140010]MCW3798140.1 hypothetical protein [Sphingomonas sp. BN140010]
MDQTVRPQRPLLNSWRVAGWGCLLALLCLPAIAMRAAPSWGFDWTASDFVFAGVMFGLVGTGFELAFRRAGSWAYRAAAIIAVLASFFLVWLNLAVGIIGNEDNPANLMFGGVLGIGLTGSLVARFGADGMSRTMALCAGAQAFAGAVALVGKLGEGSSAWPWDVANLTVFFTLAWGLAAILFRKAAHA